MPRPFHISPRLQRLYERLDPSSLFASEDDGRISEADVGLGRGQPRTDLAFGVYSRLGIERALASYGMLRRLEARGLGPVEVRLLLDDPFRPRIVLWSTPHQRAAVDLELCQVFGERVGLVGEVARAPLLFLESIVLQDPGRRFDWSRPPLPGQELPGLSLFSSVLELLALLCQRIGVQGIVLVPSSFHAAWIYERSFRFVDGGAQGLFEALRYEGGLRPLWLLAWAIELGCVEGPGGAPYHFEPSPMLCPLTGALAGTFETERYARAVRRAVTSRFSIHQELLRARFPWSQMPPEPPPERVRSLLGIRATGNAEAAPRGAVHGSPGPARTRK